MKNKQQKNRGIVQGTTSGILISVLLHAAAFLLAGLLVVFTVTKSKEVEFEPPKAVERPKMKLKKPKVKVKKSSRPKSTQRIATTVKRQSMPNIELPEMSGLGDGLGGDIGGFEMMPDVSDLVIFGSQQSIGNDFVGTFYDTKRLRSGTAYPGISQQETCQAIVTFVRSGWKPSKLSKYYRSPQKLYATAFAFPTMPAAMVPEAYGEKEVPGYAWLAHYKGELVYPEDIKFRFWGQGDNMLIVRVGEEIVLVCCHPGGASDRYTIPLWQPSALALNRRYPLDKNFAVVGDWIELKGGEPVNMEVIIAVPSGGLNCFVLCVEEEGKEYPDNPFGGGPKLPIFKTAELSQDVKDQIYAHMYEDDFELEEGPIFCDYPTTAPANASTGSVETAAAAEPEAPPPEPVVEKGPREWTLADGRTFEGEFIVTIGGKAKFKPLTGRKNIEVPLTELTREDQDIIQLSKPPEFKIDFVRTTTVLPPLIVTPYWNAVTYDPDVNTTFGVRLKQMSPGQYDYPLTVRYYALGKEVHGNNMILLSRKEETFNPAQLKDRTFEFTGETVKTRAYTMKPGALPMRGIRYSGNYMITVTDSRGVVIQHECAPGYLFDIRHKLDELGMRNHFNKEGERITPTPRSLTLRICPLGNS